MHSEFNSEMLSVGREFRGMSQTQLAKAASITQGQLSKLENGLVDPDAEVVAALVDALEVPVSFLYQAGRVYGAPVSVHAMFRKSQQISKKLLSKVTAELNLRLLATKTLLKSVDLDPAFKVPSYDIEDEAYSPTEIADLVRRAWLVRPGPIKNLVALMESAGILVAFSDFAQANIDGVTICVPGMPPCVFINSDRPADRQRFSLAHELGHIVMHSQPNENMEDQANEFASSFLMPAKEFKASCPGEKLDIPELANLKSHWRVSMQAALFRAKTLGVITDNQSSYLWRKLSMLGYRTSEPASTRFEAEKPQVLSMILKSHAEDLGYSLEQICSAFRLYEKDVVRLMPVESFRPEVKRVLKLVKS